MYTCCFLRRCSTVAFLSLTFGLHHKASPPRAQSTPWAMTSPRPPNAADVTHLVRSGFVSKASAYSSSNSLTRRRQPELFAGWGCCTPLVAVDPDLPLKLLSSSKSRTGLHASRGGASPDPVIPRWTGFTRTVVPSTSTLLEVSSSGSCSGPEAAGPNMKVVAGLRPTRTCTHVACFLIRKCRMTDCAIYASSQRALFLS